ncbi:LytR C-terminal domain-containing protein [Bifidobacterium magnum]|uniref:LytR cell envelope-related transcriptional attenuator n=1 Tax=Bifidobacterium magnum TaxID=1692 RepID=A0A087B9V3_9BIFI|nr:LytR C-terminal domain-containing protein [Bifidobacterium magnum]KFI67803.1 LytR cell envelope-related transcriptional attenuator [Bifidobacterium magnum]
MAQKNEEREARKAYMRRRQTKVFSTVGVVLAVVLVIALLVAFHVGGLGTVNSSEDEPNYGVVTACPVASADGSKGKYLDNRNVTVRVLNGTSSAGFAGAVGSALENREFVLQSVDNYKDSDVKRTTIYFGKNAINEAYTVAGNIPDAQMVMDNRDDKLVDVVLGSTFDNLTPESDVPKTNSDIKGFSNCVDASKLGKLPAAEAHNNV